MEEFGTGSLQRSNCICGTRDICVHRRTHVAGWSVL